MTTAPTADPPRPFAHIRGVSYPAAKRVRRPSPPPAVEPAPPSPMDGVVLRASPMGFRYAYHEDHA